MIILSDLTKAASNSIPAFSWMSFSVCIISSKILFHYLCNNSNKFHFIIINNKFYPLDNICSKNNNNTL